MTKRAFIDSIMPDIETYVIQNGKPHAIFEEFEYLREVVTLYAKQHNLVESTLALVDMNNNEEAYVLARSILNNYFLIGYLLNDDEDRSRLKEYQAQPYICDRFYWRNVRDIMDRPMVKRLEEAGKSLPFTIEDVDRIIEERNKQIIDAGFDVKIRPLSIKTLAENSEENGLELYSTYYAEASKYEHSDITTLDIYKQPISEEWLSDDTEISNIPRDRFFVLDMNKTNEDLKEKIYDMIISSYVQSFIKFMNEVTVKEEQLRRMFDIGKLLEISAKVIAFGNN